MSMMRTVVEELNVSDIIDKAIAQYPRLDECYDGLKWRLSREPENGVKLPGINPEKYLFKITPPVQLPSIEVLYEFENHTITIVDIKITPQK